MRNTGRFDETKKLIIVRGLRGLEAGDPVPDYVSRSRRRDWWRQGWVAYEEDADELVEAERARLKEYVEMAEGAKIQVEGPEVQVEGPAIAAQEDENPIPEEPMALGAEEGERGWWKVSFSDGTTKKMRKKDVQDLGLLEPDEDDEDDGHQSADTPGA